MFLIRNMIIVLKMLWIWLFVAGNLSVVSLKDLAPLGGDKLRLLPHGVTCDGVYLDFVKEYFNITTIKPSTTSDIVYCDPEKINQLKTGDLEYIGELIYTYRTFSKVDDYYTDSEETPVLNYGAIHINDDVQLPVYIDAVIEKKHLSDPSSSPTFGPDVKVQMLQMGQRDTDETGYLLSPSLGGSTAAFNTIPLAKNVNKKPSNISDTPNSFWRSHEDWIRNFLLDNPDGVVYWTLALQYFGDTVANPGNFRTYRPVRFTVRYKAYTKEGDYSPYYESHELSYLNNNEFPCNYEEVGVRELPKPVSGCR